MLTARWLRQTGYFDRRHVDRRFRDGMFLGLGAHPKSRRFIDSSVYGNHGTLQPDAVIGPQWEWSETHGRWALRFDGTNRVDLGSASEWELNTAGTIAAWFRLDASGAVTTIVGYGDDQGGGALLNFGVRTNTTPGNAPRLDITFARFGGAINGVHGSTTLQTGVWYHAAAVSDGSSYSIYLNGVAESLTTWAGTNSGDWFGDTNTNGTDASYVGATKYQGVVFANWIGLVSDPLIFSSALSPSEIALLVDPTFRLVNPIFKLLAIPPPPPPPVPGCVHGSDFALWGVRGKDAALTSVAGYDAALWSVRAQDNPC